MLNHLGSVYVIVYKGFKTRCSSVVEAIGLATMMYFVLHVGYPSSVFAIYTFLARMHGLSEKANPKADKARKPNNQIDNPKLASVIRNFLPK